MSESNMLIRLTFGVMLVLTMTTEAMDNTVRASPLRGNHEHQALNHRNVRKALKAQVLLTEDAKFVTSDINPASDNTGEGKVVASGSFVDGRRSRSNYGHLRITTDGNFTDLQQMYAAGILEGWLTAEQIFYHFHNMWSFNNLTEDSAAVRWLIQQDEWIQAHLGQGWTGPYWSALKLLMAQFQGTLDGYNARASTTAGVTAGVPVALPQMQRWQLLFVNALGDIGDIVQVVSRSRQDPVKWQDLSPHEVAVELAASGRCTAIVKILPDFSDIFMGQAAWYTYSAMVRIFKHFSYGIQDPDIKLRRLGFSSYPGELSSDDDFYMLDTGLVVLQTTNRLFNQSLYDLIQPRSVLSWQRVRIAHFLASSGEEWARVVEQYNSGTYSNSWTVVDLKRFVPSSPLKPGLLWVVEQMPGAVVASDMTHALQYGYFATYNVPLHPEVYEASGYPAFIQSQAARGAEYASAVTGAMHQLAPRAKILRRDHTSVTDLDSMKQLIRSNNWDTDPFSANVSMNALCGRGDVDSTNPRPYGCYDSKATNSILARELAVDVINGPPYHNRMPPFQWSNRWDTMLQHLGQPQVFNFQWERLTAQGDARQGSMVGQGPEH